MANKIIELWGTGEPLELAERALEAAYRYAGREPPEWIHLSYTYEEEELDRVELLRAFMLKKIKDVYARHVGKTSCDVDKEDDVACIDTIVNEVVARNLIEWLRYNKKRRLVIILPTIMNDPDLPKELRGSHFKSLIEEVGWSYEVVRLGEKTVKAGVVESFKFRDWVIARKIEFETGGGEGETEGGEGEIESGEGEAE